MTFYLTILTFFFLTIANLHIAILIFFFSKLKYKLITASYNVWFWGEKKYIFSQNCEVIFHNSWFLYQAILILYLSILRKRNSELRDSKVAILIFFSQNCVILNSQLWVIKNCEMKKSQLLFFFIQWQKQASIHTVWNNKWWHNFYFWLTVTIP